MLIENYNGVFSYNGVIYFDKNTYIVPTLHQLSLATLIIDTST